VNPHFYRLRKEAVGKDQIRGSATERCERDFLNIVLRVSKSNEFAAELFESLGCCRSCVSRNLKIFFRSGALQMAGTDDSYEKAALPVLKEARIRFERLSAADCGKRWPQMNFEGVSWSVYEPDSGFLAARRGCEAVFDAFLKSGGRYQQAQVLPGRVTANRLVGITLSGASLSTPTFTYLHLDLGWAVCFHSWHLALHLLVRRFSSSELPRATCALRKTICPPGLMEAKRPFFGVPGNHWRGFKIADDTR